MEPEVRSVIMDLLAALSRRATLSGGYEDFEVSIRARAIQLLSYGTESEKE